MPENGDLRRQYDEAVHGLADLAGTLKGVLEEFLTKEPIEYSEVTYRIKQYDSFSEKVARKGYSSPVEDMVDLCGLRIVYLYTADLERIVQLLEREFMIVESEDKEDQWTPDRFGYRSHHVVAALRNDWLAAPQFRRFGERKFEIQIRSVLMNSWAGISHQLFYKKELKSRELQRRLYRLSALMELADAEIDHLLTLRPENANKVETDELQLVLDRHLPDRIRSDYPLLLKVCREMSRYGLSVASLDAYLSKKLPLLRAIEKKVFADRENLDGVESRWMQVGIVRAVMYLTLDEYWNDEGLKYPKEFVETIESFRASEAQGGG